MIKTFENEVFGSVRVVTKEGEPWFVLADVCGVLELGNPSQVKSRLEDGVIRNEGMLDTLNRKKEVTIINEDGLYDVVMDSRKPIAKQFRKWVTGEVLPSIRIHGMYIDKDATQDQKLYNFNLLDETFANTSIEKVAQMYEDCKVYYASNKIRLDYSRSAKGRRSDKKFTVAESKIKMLKKVQTVLIERELEYKRALNFAFVSVIADINKQIIEDIRKVQHNKTKGKLAQLNRAN
ncbi:hypothetical protein E2R51_02260 [Jeotgalibacillus sp. S-D1]|uniref:BRO-N domain-containing protein n=1 Tax=Jeotgalibacillus sp. S-D1 TaxID=2552189 RepID=UPI00105970B6|nr:Bro-N domain-containing protein [Jeotgalibacillus sp. S-D1]TDL34560.1 hypothetical protein E2R51_02260 [Jeotgalibacillus sp. S-D1]